MSAVINCVECARQKHPPRLAVWESRAGDICEVCRGALRIPVDECDSLVVVRITEEPEPIPQKQQPSSPPENLLRTLWKAKLRIGDRKDEFLFRETGEFSDASATAVRLLESSPGAHLTGAEITGVERVAHLWN